MNQNTTTRLLYHKFTICSIVKCIFNKKDTLHYQPKNAMIASRTITNASSFKLSSFVQEIKVLNFSPIIPVLPGIAEAYFTHVTLINYTICNKLLFSAQTLSCKL